MAAIFNGRYTARTDQPFVVFLIGMRINKWWRIDKWLPVSLAMGPMLQTLFTHPEKGFLHAEFFWNLHGPLMVQYWRSFEDLEHFARHPSEPHLAAWKKFNQAVGADGSVGIFHETYTVNLDQFESVYGNMPKFGLTAAMEHVPAVGRRETARLRTGSINTRGRRSLGDFAQRFFGIDDGQLGPVTYTYDDVVRILGEVAANDWGPFLRQRTQGHGPGAPLDGLEKSGWRLTFKDKPSAFTANLEKAGKQTGFGHSLGLSVSSKDGKITDVRWDSPAFKAGVAPDMTLLAVNGRAWTTDVLKEAIVAAQSAQGTIDLLLRQDDTFRTVQVDYHDGLRYPHLERIDGREDRLSVLLKPRP